MARRFAPKNRNFYRMSVVLPLLAAMLTSTGCNIYGRPQLATKHQVMLDAQCPPEPGRMPAKELAKVTLPAYVIEPPDILLIDALRVVPKPPFKIQSFDALQVIVEGTLLEQPINGLYVVEPGGMLDLGPSYGKVMVGNLSLEEAQDAVFKHLKRVLKEPQVSLTLAQAAGQQQIAGEHLVAPDGTINLGTYGSVFVTGLTLEEAKVAIEKHLAQFLDAPLVSVDVFAYNSKVYYVVTEGAGFGDNIARFPVTGNETVLDAISQINGLSRLSSKDIWIARPAPSGVGCDQVLPVDIEAIMKGGSTATNYQLLPGDRVFIAQDQWIASVRADLRLLAARHEPRAADQPLPLRLQPELRRNVLGGPRGLRRAQSAVAALPGLAADRRPQLAAGRLRCLRAGSCGLDPRQARGQGGSQGPDGSGGGAV